MDIWFETGLLTVCANGFLLDALTDGLDALADGGLRGSARNGSRKLTWGRSTVRGEALGGSRKS
jgi:hypothetical protein